VKSGEKWGYINKKGEYKINPQFQDVGFFYDGLARVVSSNGKVGYISEDGKYAIPAKFKNGTNFSEGLAFVVSDGGHPTCIDKSGETKFQLKQAKYVASFSEGLAMFITVDEKVGFVDKTGKVVINPQFEIALPFFEGFAAVCQDDKWGFIDKTGKIVINLQFESVGIFQNGKSVFSDGNQVGFIDTKGAYVINPQFDLARSFREGMALIQSGRQYGYITENGKIEINPQFDRAYSFNSGLALIEQDDKYGYIDKTGKIQINPQFDDATSFFDDIAFVENADKWGIIDKQGKYLVNPQFDFVKRNLDNFSYVISDFYDASAFIKKFFEKAGDNSFDGFDTASTLQTIVDNTIYGDDVNANDKYIAHCYNIQEITDDISISKTLFHFVNPIYERVTTYDTYWGYKYETGTTKKYKFAEKIAAIEYQFDLSGDARNKGGSIANALKTEIERRYNVKMELKNGKYTAYQDDKFSFGIIYNDYSLSFYIGFTKGILEDLLLYTETMEVYDDEASATQTTVEEEMPYEYYYTE
jgi:hypothetical protein